MTGSGRKNLWRLSAWLLVLGLSGAAGATEPELITRIKQQRYHAAAALLKAGADPGQRDLHGWTAMHHAAGAGFTEGVSLLLSAGADPDSRDESGERPLHLAALRGHAPVVKLLIAAGADVKSKNLAGRTPLHLAAQAGQAPIASLLLDAGAPVNALDDNDQTPVEVAHSSTAAGRAQVMALLRRAGGKTGRYVRAMDLYKKRKAGKLPRCRGYLDTAWGMTRDQISEVQPDVQPLANSRDLVLKTDVVGLPASVFFKLPEGRLKAAVVVFDPPANRRSNATTLANYERLTTLLSRKYRKPHDQKRAWRTNKGAGGRSIPAAVASGQLTLQSTWETDWTQIVLTCMGDRGQARLTLAYTAVVRVGAEPEPVDETDLGDL